MLPSILEEPGDTILLRNAAEGKPTAVVGVSAVAAAPLLLQKILELQRQAPNSSVLSRDDDIGLCRLSGHRLFFRLRCRSILYRTGQLPDALQFGNPLLEGEDIFFVFLLPKGNSKPISRSCEQGRLQKRC
jgi:hypothetical protein